MNTNQAPDRPPLEVRSTRASSVIVQRIPPDAANLFMEWQRGISAEAAKFPGYQTTEIFPPTKPSDEWVAMIHFDEPTALQTWLDSPKRAEWVAKLPTQIRDFHLKMIPSGFGAWFAGLNEGVAPLPHWKNGLAVLFGLYPTVMTLTLFLAPHTQRFGTAIAVLIGNTCSVIFLEWLGSPVITRLLGPWLRANGKDDRVVSLVGFVLIVATLAVMAFLFSLAM